MSKYLGEWVQLKKPFAVLNKADSDDGYATVGVIRHKLVFKSRPTPITRAVVPSKRARDGGA